MDIIEYRKKIGIKYNKEQKFEKLRSLIFNIIDGVYRKYKYTNWNTLNNIGRLYYDTICVENADGYYSDIKDYLKNQNSNNRFIYYSSIFFTILHLIIPAEYQLQIKQMKTIIEINEINYYIEENDNWTYFFEKSNKEMDEKLIIEPLEWLHKYPNIRKLAIETLNDYYNPKNTSNIVDEFRKLLEQFMQAYFKSNKILKSFISDYGNKLKLAGVSTEIASEFEKIVNLYDMYNNNHAKHHKDAKDYDVEYIMYETFNIIRLLLQIE